MNGWEDKRDACVLNGNFLHMRCCGHIVNLIVCEGLKEAYDSIVCIRNAVKFVKSSPARFEKLKECAALEKIESKFLVFLDVPTRWNSTYLMLEAAIKFQKAFDKLLEKDIHYVTYFQDDEGGRRRSGLPTDTDWENAAVFVKFLKNFYNVTLNFSASLHVTSCSYFDQVCTLVAEIDEWANIHDLLLCGTARNMKKKLDKYWGRMDEVNQVLLVACVLDPRHKLDYVEYCFDDIYKNEQLASDISRKVKATLVSIYEWYMGVEGGLRSMEGSLETVNLSVVAVGSSTLSSTCHSRFREKKVAKDSLEIKNDVERYLLDACEDIDNKEFDVLNWWKVNGNKYGILSKLARDVLVVQVSTVASESAFSTCGRILDPFRSSLTPKTVEVLVCTQNWLKASPNLEGFSMEDLEHYNKLEQELGSLDVR